MGILEILENRAGVDAAALFAIAKRENNARRQHLLVNFLQAKHIPVAPSAALALFARLGDLLAAMYSGKKILVIGFAETATAVGAAVAQRLGDDAYYLHTSREAINAARIVDFSEEHSHATEQTLFCSAWETACANAAYILFVEDEITTGKTILNFIAALRANGHVDASTQFIVASLINGMDAASARRYSEMGIRYHFLLQFRCEDFSPLLQGIPNEVRNILPEQHRNPGQIVCVQGKLDPRSGVLMREYAAAVSTLADVIVERIGSDLRAESSVLVLGTEEFMYPAIQVARVISERAQGSAVSVHATTRSPIVPCADRQGYPLVSRYALRSLYDATRQTYIYNLRSYDQVVVLTDAPSDISAGVDDLANALEDVGCKKILFVKWGI